MIYGHRWVSSYGESDDGTWRVGLSDLTLHQIKLGLEKCRVIEEEWPPSLPMFRGLCLFAHKEIERRVYFPDRTPAWSNCTKEVVEHELREMKKILRTNKETI